MAQGVDQWSAKICLKLGIPFIAAVPFIGQEKHWAQEGIKEYKKLLKRASDIEIVSKGGYAYWKMSKEMNSWLTILIK